jgi:predicted ATPase
MTSLSRVRSVITGGPGAGKSTLLAALADAGIATFAEVARDILKAPGGMEMRAEHPADFAEAMLAAELRAWDAAPVGASVYDRGFPDIVGFLTLANLPVPDALDRVCRELRYEGPLFRAPPWREIYSPDEERIQGWEEAVASDAAVTGAWKHYGYRPIDLPLAPVADRVAFVRRHLEGVRA